MFLAVYKKSLFKAEPVQVLEKLPIIADWDLGARKPRNKERKEKKEKQREKKGSR
jgi:hypothetical protein